jgi:hypothetical protein
MAVWKWTLDLEDVFHNEEMTYEQRRDEIVRRIKAGAWYVEDDFDLVDLTDQLEFAEEQDHFNDYWNDFYNWADDARLWIKTF